VFKVLLFVHLLAIVSAYLPKQNNKMRVLQVNKLKLNIFGSDDPPTTSAPTLSDKKEAAEINSGISDISKKEDSALPMPTGFDLGSISTVLIYGYLAYLLLDTLSLVLTGKSIDFSSYGK